MTEEIRGGLQLKRQLSLFQITAYITGGIVGVGIFVSPSVVLEGSGSSMGVSLLVWMLCAFISYCGALCYAELGMLIPKSGGSYMYIREAFGNVLGFMCCWSHLVLVRPLGAMVASLAASEYFLRPLFLFCPEMIPPNGKKLLAATLLCITIMANSASVRISSKMQIVSTACKILALLTIIITGMVYLCQGNYENLQHPFRTKNLTPGGLVMAFYTGWYAFMGWDNGNTALEEIRNPKRVLPLAILVGLTIPTVVYLLAVVAYHVVLTNDDILSGVAVAVIFGEKGLGFAKWMIVPSIGISALGVVNAIAFVSSRYNFVAGRDGLLPPFLGMVNIRRKTPEPSIYALLFFALFYLIISDYKYLIGSYSFIKAIGEALAILGLFRIRKMYRTSTADVYRTPWPFPVIYVVFFLIVSTTAIIYNARDILIPVTIALFGLPMYYLSQTNSWKNGKPMKLNNFITSVCQKLLLCDFSTDVTKDI